MYRKIKVDVSNLPTINGRIQWNQCTGLSCNYYVEDTEFTGQAYIEAEDGNKLFISISDSNTPFWIVKASFVKGNFAKHLGFKAKIFKHSKGEIIQDLEILECLIIHGKTMVSGNYVSSDENGYKVKCLRDGYIFETLEKTLERGRRGCPICCSSKAVDGFNSLFTTSPQLAKWFTDPEIPHHIARDSNKSYDFICPYCGRKFQAIPNRIKGDEPSCLCRDGHSYPEKMFGNILSQLHIHYIPQLNKSTFEWCLQYKYDFYFEIKNQAYIVELDGGIGHGNNQYANGISAHESLQRDRIKDTLARENGVTLFRIDVNYPDVRTRFEYIKFQLLQSPLREMLDFEAINWDECRIDSEKSIVIKCGQLWEEGFTLKEISEKLKIGQTTTAEYLRKCASFGICTYVPHNKRHYTRRVSHTYLKVMDEENHILCIHQGIKDFSKNSQFLIGKHVGLHQIYTFLSNPNTHNRNHLKFEYSNEQEYLDFYKKKGEIVS